MRHAALSSLVVDRNVVKEHTINLISGINNNIVLLDFLTVPPFMATIFNVISLPALLVSSSKRIKKTPCLLDIELFHYLVALTFAMPTLYSSEEDSSAEGMTSASKVRIPTYAGINDYNLLRFVMTAHVVQIMISAKLETRGTSTQFK